jgi:hypothetical protein
MDPDAMLTIAFVGYAVLVAVGIGVLFLITHGAPDPGIDDGPRRDDTDQK